MQVLNHAKITNKLLGIMTNNAQSMIATGQELKQDLNNYELVHQCYILNIFVVKNRDLSSLYLQNANWLVVNNMIQLLKPIFIVTKILSTSTYPTINECMVAESINFKLEEYWEYINNSTTIGILLDLQSKTKTFRDTNQYENA
ncbi:17419_t:CDS:2, partial [Gigaspora margarita]